MKKLRIEKKTALKCISILAPLAAVAVIAPKVFQRKRMNRI